MNSKIKYIWILFFIGSILLFNCKKEEAKKVNIYDVNRFTDEESFMNYNHTGFYWEKEYICYLFDKTGNKDSIGFFSNCNDGEIYYLKNGDYPVYEQYKYDKFTHQDIEDSLKNFDIVISFSAVKDNGVISTKLFVSDIDVGKKEINLNGASSIKSVTINNINFENVYIFDFKTTNSKDIKTIWFAKLYGPIYIEKNNGMNIKIIKFGN